MRRTWISPTVFLTGAAGAVPVPGAPTSPTKIIYTGRVTFTAGTGAVQTRARSRHDDVTTDTGAHKACTVTSKLTGT